jgi:ornithine carbamoyltransferase
MYFCVFVVLLFVIEFFTSYRIMPKHLLTLLDYSAEEICVILNLAKDLKKRRLVDDPKVFAGKSGVLIFEKPSLRTRITFETAIIELGGHCINLEPDSVRMGQRESVPDIARNLSRWVHLIVSRTFLHKTIEELAANATIPVINALSDKFHPCQALAFGLTLQEHRPDIKKANIVFVGDGNNVANCIMVLCAKLGHNFILACPKGYEPDQEIVRKCTEQARHHKATVMVTHDLHSAVADATVIYTDVWTSMGQETESEKRRKDFAGFQINHSLIERAPRDVLVSHCLPAHRGEEITSDVLDAEYSVAFDEAENRLHVQKAVICRLFS